MKASSVGKSLTSVLLAVLAAVLYCGGAAPLLAGDQPSPTVGTSADHPSDVFFVFPGLDLSVDNAETSYNFRGTIHDADPEPLTASYRVVAETTLDGENFYQAFSPYEALPIGEAGDWSVDVPLIVGGNRIEVRTEQQIGETPSTVIRLSPRVTREPDYVRCTEMFGPYYIEYPATATAELTVPVRWGPALSNDYLFVVERRPAGGGNWVGVYSGSALGFVDGPDSGQYVYRVRHKHVLCGFPGFPCIPSEWVECSNVATVPPGRSNPTVEFVSGNTQTTREGVVMGTASDADGTVERVQWRPSSNSVWNDATPLAPDWSSWSFPTSIHLGTSTEFQVRAIDDQGFFPSPPASKVVSRPDQPSHIDIANLPTDASVPHTTMSVGLSGTIVDDDPEPFGAWFRVATETRYNAQVFTSYSNDEPMGLGTGGAFSIVVPLNYGTQRVEIRTAQYSGAGSSYTQYATATWRIVREFPPANDALLCLTDTGEVWASVLATRNPLAFSAPYRAAQLGYRHKSTIKWQTIAGDFTGDGVTDLACATQHGDLWMARGDGSGGFAGNAKQSRGWKAGESLGFGIVAADVDGDGIKDVVNIRDGFAWVALAEGGAIPAPQQAGGAGIRYEPLAKWWVGAGRFNDDAKDDLVQSDPYGRISVALATSSNTFAAPVPWGELGYVHDRAQSRDLHVGDFNGDGREDLVAITVDGRQFVGLSTGTSFATGSIPIGQLGFRDAPNSGLGWSTHVADLNGDGRDDLKCLTEYTDVWGSLSNSFFAGNWQGFGATPSRLAWLGFQHKDAGPWQTFPARLAP